ncbi:unnamed protein product, partial [Ostreobium quekettii]
LPTKVVEISTDRGYNDAVTKAADEGKLAVIDFTAKWQDHGTHFRFPQCPASTCSVPESRH